MPGEPVTEELAACIAAFFRGGRGPSHRQLTEVFNRWEVSAFDVEGEAENIGKERRVRAVLSECAQHPSERGSGCVRDLIARIRAHGCFDSTSQTYDIDALERVRRAFAAEGWHLSDDGILSPTVLSQVASSERRPAIEAHIARTRRASEDPALLLGVAKELLETVSKYVLEELGIELQGRSDFDYILFSALDRLKLTPQSVDVVDDITRTQREVFDGLWRAAKAVNSLRNLEGTGHGRTTSPKTHAAAARAVVQAAGVLSQLMIGTLDAAKDGA